jgi:hypothetical protein
MKINYIIVTAVAAGSIFMSGCSVEQTREAKIPDIDVSADAGQLPKYEVTKTQDGEMPTVDVDSKGGQLPAFDIDVADVDVSAEKKTVDVPKPIVVVEEESVEVPDVDVEMPDHKKETE